MPDNVSDWYFNKEPSLISTSKGKKPLRKSDSNKFGRLIAFSEHSIKKVGKSLDSKAFDTEKV